MIASLKAPELGLIAVAMLLLLLIACLLDGVARSPNWLPAVIPRQREASRQVPGLPVAQLSSLANTWQTPLFSTDRSPDVSPYQLELTSSLNGLGLSGVIFTRDVQVAFIRQTNGPALKIRQGESLPNGWTLQTLTPLQAVFTSDGRTETLSLPALKLPSPSSEPPISLPYESAP
ncbi:putative proteinral secretion pathway protein GspN [Pseudomonas syringae pv. helianthi]|uniref:Proteinral secretion pathway protein N n=1 Tax=Pseudomonas syringae pv. helianthi TaxID=251654 RepID=A0A3M6CEV4_9PSED|nr:general secretion pathway protein GspN [Pseudomonas syringae group genomosp. 7]RMV42287.1 putative proteinral secretion pathway protein GspN [Pseudomonas syringae pv. helianthi]